MFYGSLCIDAEVFFCLNEAPCEVKMSQDLYVETPGVAETPFEAYLATSDEKPRLRVFFDTMLFPHLKVTGIRDRPVRVLDLGCGGGNMSMHNIELLQGMELEVRYTAVDPYADSLASFQARAEQKSIRGLELVQSDIEAYEPSCEFDLVIVCQSLYYVQNMQTALRRILRCGREIVVVHHGEHGMHEVQTAFRPYACTAPNTVTTGNTVAQYLRGLPYTGRALSQYSFPAYIDTSSYGDEKPDPARSNALTSFFLQRSLRELPAEVPASVRMFVRRIAPAGRMRHDVEVLVIS